MPTAKEKRVTPAGVIEDELGEKRVEAYVARRHPISGQLQERPLLRGYALISLVGDD